MKKEYQPIFLFVTKLILAITFIYSSYHKIEDPAGFAKILYGYAVFPEFSINILAILIPIIELTAGFFLFFNLMPRSAVWIINGLLLCFVILISFNLIRGHEFDCGCFSSALSKNPTLSNIFSLVRDVILLGFGIYYLKLSKPMNRRL